MVLGEDCRVVQDQLQLVAIETGLYRGRGIFYMKTEVFVDILYAKIQISEATPVQTCIYSNMGENKIPF